MRRLNPLIAILAAVLVPLGALAAAAPASASSSTAIYRQCEQNGQLTGNFTRAQLQAALNGLPSEVSEYSDCQDLIQQALLRAASPGGHQKGSIKRHVAGGPGGRSGGSGKGSSGTGTGGKGPSRGSSGSAAGKGSNSPITLAGSTIRPDSTGAGAASSALPVALVVVLILLALTAVSGGAVAIRRRVVARHST